MSGISFLNRITGATNNLVYLETSDSSAVAFASGYLLAQAANIAAINEGAWTWEANDLIIVSASDGVTIATISSNLQSLVAYGALAPSVSSVSLASATPGTVRAIYGKISDSVLMTSGNIVGVRGEADPSGASGGFIYGAQGKVIGGAATYSGSVWVAGVFGQFDISASTINGAQFATLWGDYGASSGTLTSQTGLYGIAMTNTTHVVTEGQIYLYGGSQNLLLLDDNNGLVGATYFLPSGTGSGSWGNATPPTPSKVLRISVNGTQYYLPLVAQNT